jgi:hypothetical protein
MTDHLKLYDPRPEWMQVYHKQVDGGADRFKDWARQNINVDIDDQIQYNTIRGPVKQMLQALY